MGSTKHARRPTFPLSPQDVAVEKWKRVLRSPWSWAPVAASPFLFLIHPLAGLAGLVGVSVSIGRYWKHHLPQIEEAVVRELIEESNEDQDRFLKRQISTLHKYKCHDYAKRLERFLEIKREMERVLHSKEGALAPADEKIGKLIDTLCFEAADELRRLADIRYRLKKRRKRLRRDEVERLKRQQKALEETVRHAQDTLTETQKQLQTIVDPLAQTTPKRSALEDTIAKLKEEAAIAQRVRERLDGDHGAAFEAELTPARLEME